MLSLGEREERARKLKEERAREYREYLKNNGGRRRRTTSSDGAVEMAAIIVGEREQLAKKLRDERARDYNEYLRSGGGTRRRRRTNEFDDGVPGTSDTGRGDSRLTGDESFSRPGTMGDGGDSRLGERVDRGVSAHLGGRTDSGTSHAHAAREGDTVREAARQGAGSRVAHSEQSNYGDRVWRVDDGYRPPVVGSDDLLDELRRGRSRVRFREPDSFATNALAISPPSVGLSSADKLEYLARLEGRSLGGGATNAMATQPLQAAQGQQLSYATPPRQGPAGQAQSTPGSGTGLQTPSMRAQAAAEDKKTAYRRELEEQMRAKTLQKQSERSDNMRFDQAKLAEAAAYNPFGRAGAGAPIRDAGGNVVYTLSGYMSPPGPGAFAGGMSTVGAPSAMAPFGASWGSLQGAGGFVAPGANGFGVAAGANGFGGGLGSAQATWGTPGGAPGYGPMGALGLGAAMGAMGPMGAVGAVGPMGVAGPMMAGTMGGMGAPGMTMGGMGAMGAAGGAMSPPGPSGAFLGEDKKSAYRRELEEQMRAKDAQKAHQRAEAARYDQMKDAEIAAYNPFGRAGAGAPHRDAAGNVVSNLKAIHVANVTGAAINAPQPLYSGAPVVQATFGAGAGLQGSFSPPGALGLGSTMGSTMGSTTAYGSLGYGAPPPPQGVLSPPMPGAANPQAAQQLSYQDELKRQVEEKAAAKRLAQQKAQEEEAREAARLQRERDELKRQYEREQEERRQKEENQRKQQEELIRQRAEAEQRALEDKRKKNEARRAATEPAPAQSAAPRAPSPPIPTLRTAADARPASPPIPTMRDARGASPPAVATAAPARDTQASSATSRAAAAASDPEESTRKVMDQLTAMRKQLQTEQKMLETQMARGQESVAQLQARLPLAGTVRTHTPDAAPYVPPLPRAVAEPPSTYVPSRPGVDGHRDLDIMDILNPPRRGRSPSSNEIAREFDSLKYRETNPSTRRRVMERYPEPPRSGDTLDAQQRAVLREQARELNDMRASYGGRVGAAASSISIDDGRHTRASLHADSRFVAAAESMLDVDGGARLPAAHGRRARKQWGGAAPQPTVSSGMRASSPGGQSTASFNLESISRKNEERLRRLETMGVTAAPSAVSVAEPVDVLDQLMRRGRPLSGRSMDADTYQLTAASKRSLA